MSKRTGIQRIPPPIPTMEEIVAITIPIGKAGQKLLMGVFVDRVEFEAINNAF